jgi:hypothetical protein
MSGESFISLVLQGRRLFLRRGHFGEYRKALVDGMRGRILWWDEELRMKDSRFLAQEEASNTIFKD